MITRIHIIPNFSKHINKYINFVLTRNNDIARSKTYSLSSNNDNLEETSDELIREIIQGLTKNQIECLYKREHCSNSVVRKIMVDELKTREVVINTDFGDLAESLFKLIE